mgnify:CR=1 FL=1
MLEREFEYFKKNHDELYRAYPDKYLVIKGKDVLYAEDTFEKALEAAVKGGNKVGEFIIQLCSEGDSAYTQMFHSRAIFV